MTRLKLGNKMKEIKIKSSKEQTIERYIELAVIDSVAKHIPLFDSTKAGYDFVEHYDLKAKIETLSDSEISDINFRILVATERTVKIYNS